MGELGRDYIMGCKKRERMKEESWVRRNADSCSATDNREPWSISHPTVREVLCWPGWLCTIPLLSSVIMSIPARMWPQQGCCGWSWAHSWRCQLHAICMEIFCYREISEANIQGCYMDSGKSRNPLQVNYIISPAMELRCEANHLNPWSCALLVVIYIPQGRCSCFLGICFLSGCAVNVH